MGRTRTIITLEENEAKAIKAALDSREATEPVVREIRSYLTAGTPGWGPKLKVDDEVDDDRLDELSAVLDERLTRLRSLPQGEKADRYVEKIKRAQSVVSGLSEQVSGNTASLQGGNEFAPQ